MAYKDVDIFHARLGTKKMLKDLAEKYPDIKMVDFVTNAIKDAIVSEELKRQVLEEQKGETNV